MSATHILVVDDEPDICALIKDILEDEGYEIEVAENGEQARRARRLRRPDLLLLDIWLPDIDGITLLKEWQQSDHLTCPVVVMSGHGTVETAVEATRLGAYDFLEKPLSMAKLLLTVERALEADKLTRENIGLRNHVHFNDTPGGSSAVMVQLRDQVNRIAQHDTSVLITGEPGTGKETFARYLHRCSPRQHGTFVDVGVAAIARENSAVELFGSEEGGTVHYGRLEQANGGTLFLDEVGDMDSETQARLLSALETRSFLRIGGSESVNIDVRIIAATRRDLDADVRAGDFRDDLYYHLNVVPVRIPPLREHAEDVPELLGYYVDHFSTQDQLPRRQFAAAALVHLQNHSWPGNIRELKNVVQRLLILGSDSEIGLEEVEIALGAVPAKTMTPLQEVTSFELPLREAREQFERQYLDHQLQACGGSVGQMAKLVGMERTHLYRKLRALGINPKQVSGTKS